MSQPDSVAQLLEAAVPPIPASLRIPPYQRIRRRALRRRLAVACSAGAVIVVLAAAGAVATINIRRLAPSTFVGGPPVATVDTSSLPASPVSWRVARVDRAGTGLTLYVNPPPGQGCESYPNPTATVDEGSDIVTIAVTAQAVDEGCSRTMATQLHVTLSRPLLDRKVRDGNDGVLGVAVQERDLPIMPPQWTEVPVEYGSVVGGLTMAYTRSGGPDLIFSASVGTTATTGPAVRLGTRNGVIETTTYVAVQWQVGNMAYTMRLMPIEGQTSTVAQLHEVIDQLTWP